MEVVEVESSQRRKVGRAGLEQEFKEPRQGQTSERKEVRTPVSLNDGKS